ncbi:hypothetical protein, conserved [Eimeria brunetti]|uniref:Uncharacterized protein n=1 Tax=Eimeria brunetti TaxID=51314 RepID=U6LHP7_9EIME|nr:hypothetical protein, conserved [Eimeria brunetti]
MATVPATAGSAVLCSGSSGNNVAAGAAQLPHHLYANLSTSVTELQRPLATLHGFREQIEQHAKASDNADAPHAPVGLHSLSTDVRWPPLLPQQSDTNSAFWRADGSFSCDWEALRAGEAFCSYVNACCVSCLSRALGGPSEMTSTLLKKLRTGAKTAIKEEVDHLIQTVKASCANSQGAPAGDGSSTSEASEDLREQLLKHPALQAVAFLSVHERRLAVFEMWLDRWQVLSRDYHCTCGSAEATTAGLNRITSYAASTNEAETKTAIEDLRAQVDRLREEARLARQEEEAVVTEARTLSAALLRKQRELLLATERVKTLEKVQQDPTFGIVQHAQQRLPPASSDGEVSKYKESLDFISEKCNKLANLTQLIRQQFPQPQTTGSLRPGWEASQLVAAAGDAPDTPADGGLLGDLRELQTPHASMHSPHSLRARASPHAASPVVQAKSPCAAPPFRQLPTGADDARPRAQKTAPTDGTRNRSPLRRGNLNAAEEARATPAGAAIPPLTSPDSRHRKNAPVESGNNKRAREAEETTLRSRWRRALNPESRHTELDMDVETAWQPVQPTTRGDPMQTAGSVVQDQAKAGSSALASLANLSIHACLASG